MTYKLKSLIYLLCFMGACAVYYQMELEPATHILAEETKKETPVDEELDEEEALAALKLNQE